MKHTFLIAGFFFLFHSAGAQSGYRSSMNKPKRICFSINPGFAIPMQDFAKSGRPDTSHAVGYASSGFHFDIGVSYLIFDYAGIAANLSNNLCSLNTSEYAAAYNVPDSFSVTAAGQHYIATYLIGPYFNWPISDDFNVEVKAMFGEATATYPDITIQANNLNNPTYQEFKFAVGQGFAYTISACAKAMVQKNVALVFTTGYTSSDIVYPGGLFTIRTPPILKSQIPRTYNGFSDTDMHMKLGIMSITFGAAICF